MSVKMRRSPQTALVLAEFLSDEQEWRYGYDLSRNTGLKSGTLYPILMRLAEHRMLKTSWETAETGRPATAHVQADEGRPALRARDGERGC